MNYISTSNHAIIFFFIFLLVFVTFKNSLSQNLNSEKSDRILFSLKTPIWFAEGNQLNNKVEYTPVDTRVSQLNK